MPRHPNTGWNPELENFERLLAGLDSDDFLKAMRGHYQEVRLDPRKIMVVENQGGQGACFPAGTKVLLADRTSINIEDVKVGDQVVTHRARDRQVVNTMSRLYTGDLVTVEATGWPAVVATADHQFWVIRNDVEQWVPAGELVDTDLLIIQGDVGDYAKVIQTSTSDQNGYVEAGQIREIRNLTRNPVEDLRVFDFEVAEDHSFCAVGYVVHNCAGHSLSSIDEWCYAIATGGEMIQLSRAMAYYEAQRISGIRGDQGSTIEAGVKLVTETGLCLESLWMYPRTYNPARPTDFQAVLASAKQNRLKQKIRISSYEAFRTFLGSGQGGIHTGISWGDEMNRAVVETFSGGFGGGHSICGLCLSERVDSKGRPYCWIKNSWGHQFGSKVYPGWQEWSPAAIEAMCRHRYTAFVGLSDLDRPEPRKFSLADWKQKLKPYGDLSHAT